jgi:hypothetical protein
MDRTTELSGRLDQLHRLIELAVRLKLGRGVFSDTDGLLDFAERRADTIAAGHRAACPGSCSQPRATGASW